MLGALIILTFGGIGAPDTAYIENEAGDLFLDDEISVERYNTTFEHLRATALSSRASADLLSRRIREAR